MWFGLVDFLWFCGVVLLYFFDDKCFKIGLEMFFREGKGRVANFGLIELESLKTLEGLAEGIDGLLAEEDTVFAVNNVIKSATVAVGDDWAAAGESFDGGNAKRFERGEDVAFGLFEIFFEALLVLKGNEFDVARFFGEFNEIFVFWAFANNGERKFEIDASFDGEVETFPSDLARGGDEAVAFARFCHGFLR